MNKTELLLGLAADSMKMPGWNDALSYTVGSSQATRSMPMSRGIMPIADEDLCMVAGGVETTISNELKDRLKRNLYNK